MKVCVFECVCVCPLRPSGYYTPTDGALPFIAHTFCEFSHFSPQKHLFYVDVRASAPLHAAVSASMRSMMERKRRGRGEKAETALSFWEVKSNDIST